MNILITGAGSVMGQSIYKALALAGMDEAPQVHFANSDELGAGRYFSKSAAPVVATPIFPLAASPDYTQFLEKYVDEHEIDIVFSGTQHELAKISEFRDRTIRAATIPSDIAQICMDKVRTAAVLRPYRVAVPETWTFEEYLDSTDITGAVIVKPNHSSSSRDIYHIENRSEIGAVIGDVEGAHQNFLVQQWLQGDEYTCGCYIDRYSQEIHQITLRRTLTADGATHFGQIVHDENISSYVEKVGKALIDEGLDFGHINVQLILTESGPVLFEINGRLSSTEVAKAQFGFNSCAAFVSNIVNKESYGDWNVPSRGSFLRFYEEIYLD